MPTTREPLPWSKTSLRRLGEAIRDGVPPPAGTPTYDDVMLWYNDLAAAVQSDIKGLDWEPLLGNRPHEVTARAKTIDTLRDKLQRRPGTPLANIQDVAGVRFEAEMTLDEQDAVAHAIAAMYDQPPTCINDIREVPHSGYRAIHLRLRLEAPVEVQVRTHLQGGWANMYERLADVYGRAIRYGEVPSDPIAAKWVVDMQTMSVELGSQLEALRNADAKTALEVRESLERHRHRVEMIVHDANPLPIELATAQAQLETRLQEIEAHQVHVQTIEAQYKQMLTAFESKFDEMAKERRTR